MATPEQKLEWLLAREEARRQQKIKRVLKKYESYTFMPDSCKIELLRLGEDSDYQPGKDDGVEPPKN